MPDMNLAPVPSESSTCANCGADLVSDQRYCLACGHPVSPVRLAFLDVLQAEHQPQASPSQLVAAPAGAYMPLLEPAGAPGWLRRYSGLFGVLSVLLLAMVIGLLVGHWVTQNNSPSQQVIKVEGLTVPSASAAAGAATTPTTTTSAPPPSSSSNNSKKEEAEEAAEAKAEKAKPPPAPVKVSSGGLQKLGSSTGKKHQEEVNKLGTQPIETGGGGGSGSSSTPAPSSGESSKPIGGGSKVESIE